MFKSSFIMAEQQSTNFNDSKETTKQYQAIVNPLDPRQIKLQHPKLQETTMGNDGDGSNVSKKETTIQAQDKKVLIQNEGTNKEEGEIENSPKDNPSSKNKLTSLVDATNQTELSWLSEGDCKCKKEAPALEIKSPWSSQRSNNGDTNEENKENSSGGGARKWISTGGGGGGSSYGDSDRSSKPSWNSSNNDDYGGGRGGRGGGGRGGGRGGGGGFQGEMN
jgi:hypothetical protein